MVAALRPDPGLAVVEHQFPSRRADVSEFARQLHDALCVYESSCKRGEAHQLFYEERVKELMRKLEPEIGAANVPLVVLTVIEELL